MITEIIYREFADPFMFLLCFVNITIATQENNKISTTHKMSRNCPPQGFGNLTTIWFKQNKTCHETVPSLCQGAF